MIRPKRHRHRRLVRHARAEHGAESKLTGAVAPLFLVTFDADGESGAEGTVPPDDDICSKISITLRLRSNTEIFVPFSLLLAMPNVVLQFLCQDNGEGLTKSSSVSSSSAVYLPFFANDETTLTTFLANACTGFGTIEAPFNSNSSSSLFPPAASELETTKLFFFVFSNFCGAAMVTGHDAGDFTREDALRLV